MTTPTESSTTEESNETPTPTQSRTLEDVEHEWSERTNLMVENLAHMIIELKQTLTLKNEYIALSKFEIARLNSQIEEYKRKVFEKPVVSDEEY